MAETRRKSVKGFKRLDCRIPVKCWQQLNSVGGEHGLGYAVEKMCEREKLALTILESHLPVENRAAAVKALISGEALEG